MLDNLTERLGRVMKQLRGEARLTEANIQDALREVRLALLEADVALPVVKAFIGDLREKAVGAEVVGSLTPGQALIGVVARELTALMGGAAEPLDLAAQPPAVAPRRNERPSTARSATGRAQGERPPASLIGRPGRPRCSSAQARRSARSARRGRRI